MVSNKQMQVTTMIRENIKISSPVVPAYLVVAVERKKLIENEYIQYSNHWFMVASNIHYLHKHLVLSKTGERNVAHVCEAIVGVGD